MELSELIDAFVAHHRALGHSPETIRKYKHSLWLLTRCLTETGRALSAESLTTATMNAFAGWLRETPTQPWRGQTERSVYGVHGALKDVKAFVRWLAGEELILKAPKVPVPKLPQRLFPILSDEDLARVFSCSQLAGTSEIAVRNRALVAFMLDTGVRLSEAARLTLNEVDFKGGSAHIHGKGSKERLVYFSEPVAEHLRRWVAIRGADDGPLYWLGGPGIRMLFKRVKDETGLAVFTPHQVRHTAFTMLVKQGVDLHTVKRIAGHASVTTTEAYLNLSGKDVRAKHNTASPFGQIAAMLHPATQRRRRLKSS